MLSIRNTNLYIKMFIQYFKSFNCVKHAEFITDNQCIDLLIKEKKSFIRFGDGEFDILEGKGIHYQKYNKNLAKDLNQILEYYINNHNDAKYIVGMPTFFLNKNGSFMLKSRLLLSCWSHTRYYFKKHCDYECKYGNSFIFSKGNEEKYEKLWKETNVSRAIFVHNNKKYASDFEKKYKIQTVWIEIPDHDSYDNFENIYGDIINSIKDKRNSIILISAGPCGKVLTYKLANEGCWAIDTGHCWDYPLEIQENIKR